MEIRKATPGEKDYKQPGYFIIDGIVTVRCTNCFQHLSTYDCTIGKDGSVSPVTCPNCKTVNNGMVLKEFDTKFEKKAVGVMVKPGKKK